MKTAWTLVLLGALGSGRAVGADGSSELPGWGDFVVVPIDSLDDIQGDWAFNPTYPKPAFPRRAPKAMEKGVLIAVKGNEATYFHIKFKDEKVGLEAVDEALILKTDAPHIAMKRWNLVQMGEYKCLICLTGITKPGSRPFLKPMILYLNPIAEDRPSKPKHSD